MQDSPTTSRRTKRTFFGIPLIAWALLAMAGAALAAVAFYVTLNATGNVSVSGTALESDDFTFATAAVADGDPCSISISTTDPASVAIEASNLVPGDSCMFTVGVANAGTVEAFFQGFSFTPTTDPADTTSYPGFQARWDVYDEATDTWSEESDCGDPIQIGATTDVRVLLSVGWDVTPGTGYDLAAGDGFNFATQDTYSAEQCG